MIGAEWVVLLVREMGGYGTSTLRMALERSWALEGDTMLLRFRIQNSVQQPTRFNNFQMARPDLDHIVVIAAGLMASREPVFSVGRDLSSSSDSWPTASPGRRPAELKSYHSNGRITLG